jgi:hypothetical protein
MRLTPFIDDQNSRFLVYCSCARHPGFLKVLERANYVHCQPTVCAHHVKLPIENSHSYDLDFIAYTLAQEKKEYLSKAVSPTARFFPQKNEDGKPFFWVLDRGNFLYVLKPRKESLIDNLEGDHFQLFLDSKQF